MFTHAIQQDEADCSEQHQHCGAHRRGRCGRYRACAPPPPPAMQDAIGKRLVDAACPRTVTAAAACAGPSRRVLKARPPFHTRVGEGAAKAGGLWSGSQDIGHARRVDESQRARRRRSL